MDHSSDTVPVIIIGAGFSGIAVGAQLKRRYKTENFLIYDRNEHIGGTWYTNQYPGCGVDVPGLAYSLSFFPNTGYSKWFPGQAEILRYLEVVAKECDVERHVRLNVALIEGAWDEHAQIWTLALKNLTSGEIFQQRCTVLISAIGNLSTPHYGNVKGAADFGGIIVHTAQWIQNIDLNQKRIVVIGNGCSSAQVVPAIADHAHTVYQFMKTPQTYVRSHNPTLTPLWKFFLRHVPFLLWFCRWFLLALGDVAVRKYYVGGSGDAARARSQTRSAEYVKKSAPLEYWHLLLPSYSKGCKRVVRDHGFLSSLHRRNVHLIGEAVSECCGSGIFTESGKYFPADIIIFATGFNTTENSLNLIGKHGVTIKEHYERFGGVEAYKSVALSGFPNFFVLYGPNGSFAHTSALVSIEAAIGMILNIGEPVFCGQKRSVEIRFEREWRFNQRVQRAHQSRVWGDCESYYRATSGRNILLFPWSATYFYFSMLFESKRSWNYG